MTTPDAPVRFCPLCKQADTDPRHVIYGEDANVAKHMDCCRKAGCPDGSCDIVTTGAEELRGDKLRKHLTDEKNQAKFAKALENRDEATRTFTTGAAPVELKGADQ